MDVSRAETGKLLRLADFQPTQENESTRIKERPCPQKKWTENDRLNTLHPHRTFTIFTACRHTATEKHK